MKVLILGAGIIGVSTAWHLLERGHEVIVVDRQPDAALETSFANAGQISVSYCEPWANREAPLKALRWMFSKEAPLLFRPTLDPAQWAWGLRFLAQCNDAAFERNVRQLVALGAYSHAALKDLVRRTGIEYHRLERGIAHYYTDARAFEAAARAAELMQRYGVARRVVGREELLAIEPALAYSQEPIVGGTYTPSDESGDARLFTQALACRCAERGAQFLWQHAVERLETEGGALARVHLRDTLGGGRRTLQADATVVACGSFSAPLLRQVGVRLPIYPGKGYSATFRLKRPEAAPTVSLLDDSVKCAMSRLGDTLRIAGTIEVGGWDASIDSPLSQARCAMLARRVEQIFPGVCDLSEPNYWAGLRPATPTNIPFIGRTRVERLWVNAGHGTLGWTHGAGSGKALAELISGERPALDFGFLGDAASTAAAVTPRPLTS
ncbi:D-amino-acid dehydrogenase [Tibeticola sediminis]|uniref:D-amino-acid dehydrogenase n=1 Tax=Tibeticola sediminis TaxID=1917811 RepID=A0A3N4U7Q5_9BURK|nr:D-amino acid dehydrogenase [Tibeticola sediminis]RPE66786.1 D-amino-acid dehydrogenase [Tibeticola sediminis]